MRLALAMLLIACAFTATAQMPNPTFTIGGTVSGLHGDGTVLALWTGSCRPAGYMCLGRSGPTENPREADLRCTNQCCSNSSFGARDSVDEQGNETAVATCLNVAEVTEPKPQQTLAADAIVYLGVADGAQTFQFPAYYPANALYDVSVATQPANSGSCTVQHGFDQITNANISNVMVTCDYLFANGFDSSGN